MTGDDPFLTRWSRRKQEASRPDPKTAAEKDAAGLVEDSGAPAAVEALDEKELVERIARLPSIDAIDELTDITPFMQSWVPTGLRTEALRKLWTVDRAVREHVVFADYALDYNTPGAAPGYGALETTADMARRALASFSADPAAPPKATDKAPEIAEVGPPSFPDSQPPPGQRVANEPTAEEPDSETASDATAANLTPADGAPRELPVSSAGFAPSRRRHGSAAPR